MASWLKLFLHDTLKANNLKFELCNVRMNLAVTVKGCTDEQLNCMPFSIANVARAPQAPATPKECQSVPT